MAVTPVGNAVYINQNAQVSSAQHSNAQPKLDFQALVTTQIMEDKQKEIQDVRPTEQVEKTNEDGHGSKEKQESKKKENKEEEEKSLEPQEHKDVVVTDTDGTIAHLDISI